MSDERDNQIMCAAARALVWMSSQRDKRQVCVFHKTGRGWWSSSPAKVSPAGKLDSMLTSNISYMCIYRYINKKITTPLAPCSFDEKARSRTRSCAQKLRTPFRVCSLYANPGSRCMAWHDWTRLPERRCMHHAWRGKISWPGPRPNLDWPAARHL